MNTHRIALQPFKGKATRYHCPQCGHKHKFTRYIDVVSGEYIDNNVGRCDRENSCGYHYKPKQFFADNPGHTVRPQYRQQSDPKKLISRPIDYLPFEILEKSVSYYWQCNFFTFILKLFREDVAKQLCADYYIGSNKDGNTVFWQVDIKGKIRQAKVIRYNPFNGKRNKDTGALFAGKKMLNKEDANLQQCFFGEHHLSVPDKKDKPVAIVESEKTAVIASVYYPQFIWLATGGKHGCNWTQKSVCNVLAGRKVVLFPDLGAYNCWNEKGKLLSKIAVCKVGIIDLLEKYADEDEKMSGLDIADYLLKKQDKSGLALSDSGYPIIWDL
jgi:Domain of unknown function (DUF6371)